MKPLYKILITLTSVAAITTAAVVIISKAKGIGNKIAGYARKFAGIKEIKQNQGWENASDFQQKMLESGWVKGNAYCANFVSMVLQNVCKGGAKDFFKQKLSAWVPTAWANLRNKTDYSEPISAPEPGCIVFYYGHVEICDKVNGNGTMYVITANSASDDGSTEGVFRKLRTIGADLGTDPFYGFVRITKID